MANFLFYRTGNDPTDYLWKVVLTAPVDLPAKRMALFKAGHATIINPADTGALPPGLR